MYNELNSTFQSNLDATTLLAQGRDEKRSWVTLNRIQQPNASQM